MTIAHTPPLERAADKMLVGDGCWTWIGSRDQSGYGQLWVRGRMLGAHRVIYEALRGAVPSDLQLDHLCRNRACVRPSHLEPVTVQENNLRGVGLAAENAQKTTCPQGHPYDMTYGDGRRGCRTCNAEKTRRHRALHGRKQKA